MPRNARLPPPADGLHLRSRVTDTQITVVRTGLALPAPALGELIVTDDNVRAWVLDGRIVWRVQRYRSGRLLTERLSTSGRPMLAWALRLMTRGRCSIVDAEGLECDITVALLLRWSWRLFLEAMGKGALLRRVERQLAAEERSATPRQTAAWDRSAAPVYLRTDLSFGVRAGGSVGHIAGVLNQFERELGPPILLTTAPVPTLLPQIEVHHVHAPETFWNFRELPTFVMNDVCYEEALRAVDARRVSLVYQRYSLNNYAGLRLARRLGVPFVLEYNGSELWMSRHWSRPLKYESLAERIELLNLKHADLVVVVSRAMRDEIASRGVAPHRTLVNPNAVDPERYSPAIDGTGVRTRYGLEGKTVIGFISSFQPWHGAEKLAEAFVRLMRDRPDYRRCVRLLMIGSGQRREVTERIIESAGLNDAVVFTGLVEQAEGPRHLAACDILASPHVPNPDGTPFFGSPTKLFEYMAMGKGIVASDLDQIGEILRHGVTAWMVPPADADALAVGLSRLVEDPALCRSLGDAARREAVAHHTWRSHVRKTIDALEALEAISRANGK
jgi:glycosyltransferase involved in cell wall biosynthesis